MPRKTAVAHGAPVTIPAAPASAPTIATRKRARRGPAEAPPPPPARAMVVKPEIDLTRPDARKALAAAFPTTREGATIEASDEHERAALAYLEARDAQARAEGAKEAAGNVLRYAIADAEEIHGDGWIATWKFEKAEIDWGRLVKELAIETHVVERFRKAKARVLRVRETAE